MAKTILFLMVITLQAAAYSTFAQVINIKVKNASLSNVLHEIEKQSGYDVLYNDQMLKKTTPVSVSLANTSIEDALKECLKGQPVTFVIDQKTIVIKRKPVAEESLLQLMKITGTVKDEKGITIPGVTVSVKGSSVKAVTNVNGDFTINVADNKAILVFSFVGYTTEEMPVGNGGLINVVLKPTSANLNEVVVVGYGTQKRSNISGAVSTVSIEDLKNQPTTNLQGMLQGRVAGLYVTQGDAAPGGNSNVLLRGIRSLKGSNDPLYVVDGFPISDINEININDVESISVLKDASAQAIYGARASSGVILITTRRGANSNNKASVAYQANYTIENVNPNFEVYSPEEYIQNRREAFRGATATAANGWIGTYQPDTQVFTPLELQNIADKNFVNWTDYAFRKNAPVVKQDISVSGGNDKTKYAISFGYFNQGGVRMGSGLKQYSGRMTLDQKISNTFKTGLSAYYLTSDKENEAGSWVSFITFSPVAKLYDASGELVEYPLGDAKSVNPLYYAKVSRSGSNLERLILNGYLEVTPQFVPGLKYKLNVSMNSRNTEAQSFQSLEDPSVLGKGYASEKYTGEHDYLVENIITYEKRIANVHSFDLTLLQSIEPRSSKSTTATATQLGNDFFGVNSLNSAIMSEVGASLSDRKINSYMGRVNYAFNDRYLFDFTIRADGSSVFGVNNKWGYFPSASVAWNLQKETFAKKLTWLDNAKVRLSYGEIGNQAISPYGSLATAVNSFYVSGSNPVVGYLPGTALPNPYLKWETTTTANFGLDFSIFKSALSGSIDYYQSNTTNLLVNRKVPTVLGYSSIPTNLGEIQNNGIEITLNSNIINKGNFKWSVSGNFSVNKNKLVKGVLQNDQTGQYIDDVSNEWFIGQPINIFYNYKFDGIWQIGDDIAHSSQPGSRPGDIRVVDINGDNKITADDRVIIKADPKWTGSFFTNFEYKEFGLSANLYTVQGVIKDNLFLTDVNYGALMDGHLNGIRRSYWTPENPSNTTFRPQNTINSLYRGAIYTDASYVRLRNVTLSYNLPKKWLDVVKLTNVKLYVSGDNIFTKTDYLSYSPEGTPSQYPETRNYTVGINVKF
jgi:TonB-linked SusC/RagA family outer membrane protein